MFCGRPDRGAAILVATILMYNLNSIFPPVFVEAIPIAMYFGVCTSGAVMCPITRFHDTAICLARASGMVALTPTFRALGRNRSHPALIHINRRPDHAHGGQADTRRTFAPDVGSCSMLFRPNSRYLKTGTFLWKKLILNKPTKLGTCLQPKPQGLFIYPPCLFLWWMGVATPGSRRNSNRRSRRSTAALIR